MSVPHPPHRWFSLSALGAVLFIVLTTVAMFCYAGGTLDDPQHSGYSFFNNVFSDLGRSHTFAGRPNHVSQILFIKSVRDAGPARASILVGTAPLMSVLIAVTLLDEPWKPALFAGTLLVVAGGVVGSCILGAIFGLWPALSAAFLHPIEALRHE